MTFNKSLFLSYTAGHPSSVELGNSDIAKVSGIGNIEIAIFVHGKRVKCILQNVLHVPELGYQLLSVPTLDKSGLTTSFHSKRCWITNGSKLLATATMSRNLYELDVSSPSETALVAYNRKVRWKFLLVHEEKLYETAVAYDNQITTCTRWNINEMYLTYAIASMSRLGYLMSQTFY